MSINFTQSTQGGSESVPGVVELATAAETITGTSNTLAVHPSGLTAWWAAIKAALVSFTGGIYVNPISSSGVGVSIQGLVGQTGMGFEYKNSNGTSLLRFDPTSNGSSGMLFANYMNSGGLNVNTITAQSVGVNITITPNVGFNLTVAGPQSVTGHLSISTAGSGLKIAEGTNARMGVSTLSAGTITVSNTSVTATTRIFLTTQSLGTVTAPKAIAVTARTASTSFTITSEDVTDTSVIAWALFDPA